MVALMASISSFAKDQSDSSNPSSIAKFSDAQLNTLVEQLVKSGKLDTAIDAGIKRYVQEEQAAQEKKRAQQVKAAAEAAKNARKVNPKRDHIYGNASAPFSLIVYSDLECPFCQRYNGVPEEAVNAIGLDKINVVFRHFPLAMHGENAKKEAVAAECVSKQAGNEGFFKFIHSVLDNSQLNGKGLKDGDTELQKIAKESGAKDEASFVKCMQDISMQNPVKEDIEDGAASGVTGTPGNIIRNNKNGKSIAMHGAPPGGAKAIEPSLRNAISEVSKN